jgi:hypothetical protein
MPPTARHEIASLTKHVTAVATMKLLRLRGLDVNTPDSPPAAARQARHGLGRFDKKKVPFGRLLTHAAGIFPTTQLADARTSSATAGAACTRSPGSARGRAPAASSTRRPTRAAMDFLDRRVLSPARDQGRQLRRGGQGHGGLNNATGATQKTQNRLMP